MYKFSKGDSDHCKKCGRPDCDNKCKKTEKPSKEHEKLHKPELDKNFPAHHWPTDQEKNKGPKI